METCSTERQLLNLLDSLMHYLNDQYINLLAEEAGLVSDMSELCSGGGGDMCQNAMEDLNNLRTWEMAPLGFITDSLRELRNDLEKELGECEHRRKEHLLA